MKKSLQGTFLAILSIIVILSVNGCKKSSDDTAVPLHSVSTNPILTQLTSTTVTSGGVVYSLETISENGVCWSSTNKTPTIDDKKTSDTVATHWTSRITGLAPNTTYYLRAYVIGVSG